AGGVFSAPAPTHIGSAAATQNGGSRRKADIATACGQFRCPAPARNEIAPSRDSRMHQPQSASLESRASWVVATVALLTMLMAYGSAWITVVALGDIAGEAGGARSVPA